MLKNNQSNPFYCTPNKKPKLKKGVSPLKREKPKFWIWTNFETKNKPQNKSKTRFFTLDKNIQGFSSLTKLTSQKLVYLIYENKKLGGIINVRTITKRRCGLRCNGL